MLASHLMAGIIGVAISILSRTRASLATNRNSEIAMLAPPLDEW
jgi:hypothetical protein